MTDFLHNERERDDILLSPDLHMQGSSQKKIKEGGVGVVLRSKDICATNYRLFQLRYFNLIGNKLTFLAKVYTSFFLWHRLLPKALFYEACRVVIFILAGSSFW